MREAAPGWRPAEAPTASGLLTCCTCCAKSDFQFQVLSCLLSSLCGHTMVVALEAGVGVRKNVANACES